mmetsp:Transcript_30276/g.93697  ORF Transcript_30276/g.93697 Transcript_30276/m.93697 type:complete len:357 (-) Transcript_30276:687-1757(-)
MGVVAKRASAQAVDGVVPAGPKSTREISPPRSSKSKPRGADAAQRLALLRIARPGVPRGQTVERADGGLGGGLFRREEDHALRRIGRDGDRLATRRDDELAVRVQRVRETETEGALGALEEDDGGPQQIVVEEAVDRRSRDRAEAPAVVVVERFSVLRPEQRRRDAGDQRRAARWRRQSGEVAVRGRAVRLEDAGADGARAFVDPGFRRVVGQTPRSRRAEDEAVAERVRPAALAADELADARDGARVHGRRAPLGRHEFEEVLDVAQVARASAQLKEVEVAVVRDKGLDGPRDSFADLALAEARVDVQHGGRRPLVRVRTVERRLGRGREARVARVEARPWREAVQQPRGALVAP